MNAIQALKRARSERINSPFNRRGEHTYEFTVIPALGSSGCVYKSARTASEARLALAQDNGYHAWYAKAMEVQQCSK